MKRITTPDILYIHKYEHVYIKNHLYNMYIEHLIHIVYLGTVHYTISYICINAYLLI